MKAKSQAKALDLGSILLILVLAGALLLLMAGEKPVLYDDAQTLELVSCGAYDDGIFEYDTLEFYAVSADYQSEFLSVPSMYENFTVDSVNAKAFYGTPVRYVLLPETIVSLSFHAGSDITMFTDSEELAAICAEHGFQVDGTQAYHDLLSAAQRQLPFGPGNLVANFTALAGSPWIIAVVVGLYLAILLCAKLREKAGHEDPLEVLRKEGSITNTVFLLVQAAAAFIAFYFMLFETEEIGFDSKWLMDLMTNWPLKITIGLFAFVLISDIFNKNFFPWYLGRVMYRLVNVLIPVGIALALGAFVGTVSLQFRFIVHLIAAAPVPLFFFVVGGLGAFVFAKLGIYTKNSQPTSAGAPSASSETSYAPRSGGTTTLIAPDGTSYPVRNVGYGYMVNGKLLRDFDPHGTNRPVDEDGTEYTRY